MRQVNETGPLHNRLRSAVTGFLTKDLGLDWRRGKRYFVRHLNDFDLAANSGGWQWAVSPCCDAQPYLRIFNPVSQGERFDPQGRFIRLHLQELGRPPDVAIHVPWLAWPVDLAAACMEIGKTHPVPVVDHAVGREKTLAINAVAQAA